MTEVITPERVAEITGRPFAETAGQCHAVSLAIVKAEIVPGARVARGWCAGVQGQHSWIVVGDPYALGVPIIDPTLWSYDPTVEGVWHGVATNGGRHVPHGGRGSIWSYGRPDFPTGEIVPLEPKQQLSARASRFLRQVGPLDHRGWMMLAQSPVLGWPAAEIISAMADTPALKALIPIDILGMLTDRNPGGLYLPGGDPEETEAVA